MWQGKVEVFDLTGLRLVNPTGKEDKDERFVTVLEIPTVDSAVTAVRMQIVKDVKDAK